MKNTLKAGMLGLTAMTLPFAGAAHAEDTPTVTSASSSASITHKQELAMLLEAESKSTAHAMAGYNVGLVLHVGDDIPSQYIDTVMKHYQDFYQAEMAKSEDPRVRMGTAIMYPSPNPGSPASLISVTIGDQTYKIDNDAYGRPENLDLSLLGLETAERAASEIISQIPTAKILQSQNEIDRNKTVSLAEYTPEG